MPAMTYDSAAEWVVEWCKTYATLAANAHDMSVELGPSSLEADRVLDVAERALALVDELKGIALTAAGPSRSAS